MGVTPSSKKAETELISKVIPIITNASYCIRYEDITVLSAEREWGLTGPLISIKLLNMTITQATGHKSAD